MSLYSGMLHNDPRLFSIVFAKFVGRCLDSVLYLQKSGLNESGLNGIGVKKQILK
ncbi:hypothetical protein MTP04_16440 [Lysinibacillus sp. PLM2]|nr:hypothetical protein MTP04_16440 [Lysinibacillus sp. PLM2]